MAIFSEMKKRLAAGRAGRIVCGLLDVRSARGVSLTITAMMTASKPLGYVRTLITAWAFGTSPAMDSFHLANGIVVLFSGCIGGAMQNAFLPELERLRKESGEMSCRSFCAAAAWCLAGITVLLCAAFASAPESIVRAFASGFDAERIRISAVMMMWLAPFAAISIMKPIVDIWAMFRERYTLPSIALFSFNFAAIPALIISAPMIGAYAVAFSVSFGHVVAFLMLLIAIRDLPIRAVYAEIPWRSFARAMRSASFYVILSGLSAMYMVIDRYFASMLPSGSVAAISYGAAIITVITTAASSPMLFFLSKLSREAANDSSCAVKTANEGMAIMAAYFIPASFMLAACAGSVVSFAYGWGNFGTESADMTSTALFAYSIGLPFSLVSNIAGTYGVAYRRVRAILLLSALGVGLNTLFDWLLVSRFGLLGLTSATSMTQIIMMCVQMRVLMGTSPLEHAIVSRMPAQIIISAALAAAAYTIGAMGSIAQLLAGAVLLMCAYALIQRVRAMPSVPAHWQPSRLAVYLASSVRSAAKRS